MIESNTIKTGRGSVLLYHGSKSGIAGNIKPLDVAMAIEDLKEIYSRESGIGTL